MKAQYFDIDRAKCTHPELEDEEWLLFYEHFLVFPWSALPENPVGFELGCGTGLWTHLLSQRSKKVIGLDHRSEELDKAREVSSGLNVEFRHSDFFSIGEIDDDSMDYGVALESLHLSTDIPKTLDACVRKLKPGAPLLIYLLYLPETPLGRMKAKAADLRYRAKNGVAMDKRYAKKSVNKLMSDAGLEGLQYSPVGSYWTAVGHRRN